jgi:hypothetical protein
MENKHTDTFTASRVTFITPCTFEAVAAKLNSEIQSNGSVNREDLVAVVPQGKDAFIEYFSNKVGSFGFTAFGAGINHSWIQLFGVGGGLRLQRIMLGNPLIAITMLKYDLDAGLFVPVELLMKELPEGKGTAVVYVLPSSLVAGVNTDDRLKEAAQSLDAKLEALMRHITSP